MATLSFGGWVFGVPLPNLISSAMQLARGFNLPQLGSTTYEQNVRLAEMINWTITELLEQNTALNQTIDYPNLVAALGLGTNIIPIPDDLMGQDILTMRFYDTQQSPWMLLGDLPFINTYGYGQTPPEWRNGTFNVRDPYYWSFDNTAQNQILIPFPNSATVQLERTYRPNPALVVPPVNASVLDSGQTLPGTVATVAGSPVVRGTGTKFTSTVSQLSGLYTTASGSPNVTAIGSNVGAELIIGDVIEINGVTGTITNFTGTTIILSAPFGANNTDAIAYKIGGTALDDAVTLAAGSVVTINSIAYVIASISSATVLTLTTQVPQTDTSADIIVTTMIGEIPVRFKQVPTYRLAAYMIEMVNAPLYQQLMGQYNQAMAAMQAEITKQLASQAANMSKQARPNNVMDLASLYPAQTACNAWQ